MSYRLEFRERARKQLVKLAKRSPQIARDIHRKIDWLVANADDIRHEQLKGSWEASLHCGQYRIPYLLDRANRVVYIEDIGKHDEAYRRLKRR